MKPVGKKTIRAMHRQKEGKINPFTYNHQVQSKDVICNPRNPVNPDSKLFTGKITKNKHLLNQINFKYEFTKPYLCNESIIVCP